MAHLKRLLTLALVGAVLISLAPPGASRAQEEDVVARLMEEMSSAAKVGQLFLVTFPGAEVNDETSVAALIRDYHVGGVLLLPENDNIINEGDTLTQVATLVGQLQQTAWDAAQPVTETLGGELPNPFIPLFIAANHEGNGAPFTGIVNGTTPLPSEMAVGATWNPTHAETVGRIVGQELRALGVNVLLGPSLDVLETPRPDSAGDLGVRTFGGDPFWVGQMGQAYIRGVHAGADGRVAVVAKHFPGLGTSDRSLDEEVSTVQRTLEKLRQVDLYPFFAVAQADDPEVRPDGVLVSHIRFRGLEGERFVVTRPISVDRQALQRLLGLPELVGWREGGGVTVSDGLGVRALRRFYDPSERSFNGRRIAQEAFLAGNDLLLLSQFAPSDTWEDRIANVESTITFFRERYDSDPSFQTLVDEAVARILRLKIKLYGSTFRLSAVQPNLGRISGQVESNRETLSAIGHDAITLLSPPSPDLAPSPPTTDDNIVIFSDSRTGQPCSTCAPVPYLDQSVLRDTIVRLYGPDATGQISPWRIASFTFEQLDGYLSTPSPTLSPTPTGDEEITPTPVPLDPIEAALQNADWVLFAMLDPTDALPQSGVVRRFLAEQADALRGPQLIVLAYDAPYYLDATEVSKLSAYYVAYSRVGPCIETSVRAMFGEFAPAGALPVSVSGVNYDLVVQTSPDPEQTIALHYEKISEPPAEDQLTPEPTVESESTVEPTAEGQPTPEPRLAEGDKLKLRTGVILDHNGHPVPDGTPVQFIFTYPQEGLERSEVGTTHAGVAETTVTLDRTGQLDISVQADPVPRAIALQITIQEEGPAIVVPITPTPRPTASRPAPTPTVSVEPPVENTPPPTSASENGQALPAAQDVGTTTLILALFCVLGVGGIGYYVMRSNNEPVSPALRLALWCVIGGLALYLVYVILLPGVAWLQEWNTAWAAGGAALLGSLVPLVVARIAGWWRRAA